ncbi:dynactin subunit 2-A-like [Branchiostoma floridae x Branchiostoma japonicum]
MADPKYADLPGIDYQPDVYETSDLPEDDQAAYVVEELNSDAVSSLPVNPNSAYEKFKGKVVSSKSLDFSDRISGSRRTGYETRTEYEILGEGEGVETPQQKFQRLQCEMKELVEDVENLKTAMKDTSETDQLNPVQVSQQVQVLQKQLYELHLEQVLGQEAAADITDPHNALPKKVITQLDAIKSGSAMTKTPTKKGLFSRAAPASSTDQQVTYELYYRPEQAKLQEKAKLGQLEERIQRLEAAVGHSPEKVSALTRDASSKSLLGAVASLEARTTMLDPIQLDHIEARMQGVLQKLAELNKQRAAVEDADKQSKISELYDLMKKWESMANSLPQVVERMAALSELHEQAMQFSQALSQLDTTQQQLSTTLKSNTTMVKELQDNFATNMATIESNCKALDARLKTVNK